MSLRRRPTRPQHATPDPGAPRATPANGAVPAAGGGNGGNGNGAEVNGPGPAGGTGTSGYELRIESPPSARPGPRWGHQHAPHPRLQALLARHDLEYGSELERIAAFASDLESIPIQPTEPGVPCWSNPWLLGLDIVSIYAETRLLRPRRFIEIGSGRALPVAAQACRDGAFPTSFTAVSPGLAPELAALCDTVVDEPLETADLSVFDDLRPGDVVFFDGSHRAFQNSDAVVFFLDVLPELPRGVVVGVHDVLLPDDYPVEWERKWYSEQYLLATYLLGETAWMRPLLPCNYIAATPPLADLLRPMWAILPYGIDPRGYSFWLQIVRRAPRRPTSRWDGQPE